MNVLFTLFKVITAIFWLIFIYNFIDPFEAQWNTFILWGGILLAAAHLAEFFMFHKKLEIHGAAGINGFIQTLLFGFLYFV